jgi:hypothetical protein
MHLADTNVVSELFKPAPDRKVLAWAQLQPRLALSVITWEELTYGFGRRPNAELEARVALFLEENCELVAIDETVARRSGQLRAALGRSGHARHPSDMLIAATALEHGYVLATRNTQDFAGCGLRVINPFAHR